MLRELLEYEELERKQKLLADQERRSEKAFISNLMRVLMESRLRKQEVQA